MKSDQTAPRVISFWVLAAMLTLFLFAASACGVPKPRFPTLGGTVVLVNQPTEDVAAFQSKRTAALRRVAS